MHYHAEIWIPDEIQDVETYVAEIMALHEEAYDDNTTETNGFWDWYQIGGRWTGVHVSDYDPAKDDRNIEACYLCEGTGFRRDAIGENQRALDQTYTCNSCGMYKDGQWTHGRYGPGKHLKWSTEWAEFPGDLLSLAEIPDDLKCYTLIVREHVFHQEEWTGSELRSTDFDGMVKPMLASLGITSGRLITVDYHS